MRGVVKNAEVVDVRGPEELIVPDVEDAVCMFKQLSFWSELYISPYSQVKISVDGGIL